MTWSCIAARICQPFVRRFYVYILLVEVIRMAAMQGFLGPLSLDFVIVLYILLLLYLYLLLLLVLTSWWS